jgi:hypothetical protein
MGSRSASYEEIVEASIQIFQQYDTAITLRQLYYRLVSKLLIPNTVNSYKRLSRLMVRAREVGDVPINCLEDRSRRVLGRGDIGYNSAEDYLKQKLESLQDSWKSFTMPMWDDQPRNVLISLEKDALSRLVSRIANRYSVKTFPTRGYPSFSYVQDMSHYVSNKMGEKHTIILYFGDFDPSGVDIERDLTDRLEKYGATDFSVKRIALTADQIRQFNLPPMPVKRSDARADSFLSEHGDKAVELDALDPNILQKAVERSIIERINTNLWYAKLRKIEELKSWIRDKLTDMEKVIDTELGSI